MASNVPTDKEYWRAEALNVYTAYLNLQPLGAAIYEQMRDDAETARLLPDDERLMRLLRETGDRECLACADRYPGREA